MARCEFNPRSDGARAAALDWLASIMRRQHGPDVRIEWWEEVVSHDAQGPVYALIACPK